MNLSHLSLLMFVGFLVGRVCWLCGVWGMLAAWQWRDYLETSPEMARCDAQRGLLAQARRKLFWAFVRERLVVWIAPFKWGFHPSLSWKESVAIWGGQLCLALVTIGLLGPIYVFGLDKPHRRWRGIPIRQARRLGTTLHNHLTELAHSEAILKRAALACLYSTVEDVPACLALQLEPVRLAQKGENDDKRAGDDQDGAPPNR